MVRHALSLLLTACLLSILIPAAGRAQHMNAADVPCNRPSSNAAQGECFAKASEAAEKELNAFYAQVRAKLSADERADLLETQRAWLKYRDLTCTAEYKLYGGGTGGPVTRMACLSAVTQERIATLRTTYGWRLEK
jgi:uncharacterized protein YecT (DUF1311 family)